MNQSRKRKAGDIEISLGSKLKEVKVDAKHFAGQTGFEGNIIRLIPYLDDADFKKVNDTFDFYDGSIIDDKVILSPLVITQKSSIAPGMGIKVPSDFCSLLDDVIAVVGPKIMVKKKFRDEFLSNYSKFHDIRGGYAIFNVETNYDVEHMIAEMNYCNSGNVTESTQYFDGSGDVFLHLVKVYAEHDEFSSY